MAKQLGDFGQFWRMVWQQEVEKIVMMTNLVEGKKTKCEKYWPDQHQSKLYGDIEVVCKVEKLYADFIWRQFTLSKFTSWPHKDIPDNVTSVKEFRLRVNALPCTFDGPVVVHCSAGVGRTGTYKALDILTKEGETEGAIDIPGCVLNMRQYRPNMIQTLSQYKYLHQALVHTLTLDCSMIRRDHFSEYMEKSSKQEIQRQFKGIGFYFSGDNETLKTGMVSLRSTTDQSAGHFVKRILHLEHEGKTKKDVTIPHYEYLYWDTKHNVPKSAEHFVAFINEVEDVSKASPLKGPILLHCLLKNIEEAFPPQFPKCVGKNLYHPPLPLVYAAKSQIE
ncbi:receptor-type tyrosine-protein phosphatase C-like [Mya arenaria]|uniref:receptor-type tyrosine-protein phosphatase C-like n=1 Tax=Mya arenaria TaxID=6604 RepID=UPI0022E82B69|nr:receptor-type tyrosine-protein phosphatase C-like [Mya arenaria]